MQARMGCWALRSNAIVGEKFLFNLSHTKAPFNPRFLRYNRDIK